MNLPEPKGQKFPILEATPPDLSARYKKIRKTSEEICKPLEAEDFGVQPLVEVSPPKWHLAHTSWFFERLILTKYDTNYKEFDQYFNYLFNSYYKGIGSHHPRSQRGLLSRPTVEKIYAYRQQVDADMQSLISRTEKDSDLGELITLGLHHEQQHQELLLTDIKNIFFHNPLKPVYKKAGLSPKTGPTSLEWKHYPEGLIEIGHDGSGFSFDNERPRHRTFLEPFRLGCRLITNGEYLEFIQDGGYRKPTFWLSDGWELVQAEKWKAPLYWEERDGEWRHWTLSGMLPVRPEDPVCHVSYYEADAYAHWRGKRLPSEAQWEHATRGIPLKGNFFESKVLHPLPASASAPRTPAQLFGDVWEWTASPYTAYPGFKPHPGAVGEYNGKFMCNQMVLRGGSCFTPESHIRPTYRNFFYPADRWQCTGFRLAEDA